eukprot:scaffold219471_cov58-Attheya_sp.AAC.1
MSSASAATRALSGYRRLFRARKVVFQNDARALRESAVAIRAEFDKNRYMTGPPEHVEGLLSMIDEAADMMLHGIIQGELNPNSGNYVWHTYVPTRTFHIPFSNLETITHVDPISAETGDMMKDDGTPNVVVTSTKGDKP